MRERLRQDHHRFPKVRRTYGAPHVLRRASSMSFRVHGSLGRSTESGWVCASRTRPRPRVMASREPRNPTQSVLRSCGRRGRAPQAQPQGLPCRCMQLHPRTYTPSLFARPVGTGQPSGFRPFEADESSKRPAPLSALRDPRPSTLPPIPIPRIPSRVGRRAAMTPSRPSSMSLL